MKRVPCDTCDFHGPEIPSLLADQRNLHRALHGLLLVLLEPVDRLMRKVIP